MLIPSSIFNNKNSLGIQKRLISSLFFFLSLGLFCTVSNAETDPFALMDSMKIQFENAINKGDINSAQQIWNSIDSRFDKSTKASAYATLYAGGATRKSKLLKKLYSNHLDQFEKTALFLSSLNIQNNFNSKTTQKATFSGKVTEWINGNNVQGAKIFVAGQSITSNNLGKFTLPSLPFGRYDLIAFAPGYEFIIFPSIAINGERKSVQQVLLRKNKKFKKIARTQGAEILKGTLVDADTGKPIINAKIIMACKSAIKNTSSDKNGKFVISGIPTEVCNFSVMQSNISDFSDLYNKVKSGNDRAYAFSAQYNITAKPNHIHENIWKIKSSSLPPAGTVNGVVLNSITGAPVVGADIIVGARQIGVVDFDGKTAKSDNQGRFKIEFVPTGEQIIKVNKEIFKPSSQKIRIEARNTMDVSIKLQPITVGTITGIAISAIDHKPLAGVTISVGSKIIKTDAQGRFTLTDIDAGEVAVGGTKSIYKSASKTVNVAAAKSTNVTLDLIPITKGSISGIAYNASNHKPLSGTNIIVGNKKTITDDQGRFELKDIEAGEVNLSGSKPVFKPSSKNLTVIAAKNVSVNLELLPITKGKISGIAFNATTHLPLSNVKITAGTKSTVTNTQGQFRLNEIESGSIMIIGNKEIFMPASKTITVIAAKNIHANLNLMPITEGSISGVAYNASNHSPLSKTKISVGNKTEVTDEQGRFTIKGVNAGNNIVTGSKKVFKSAIKTVKVSAAKNITIELNLQPITQGTLKGIAINANTKKPLSRVNISVGSINVLTDEQGHFEISKIEAGKTLVLANKKVFQSITKNINIIAAESVETTLELKPITLGNIDGIALNAVTNKPLAGVSVVTGMHATKTDSNGHFSFIKIAMGNVSMQASKSIFKPTSKQIDVIAAETVKTTLKLEPITVGTVSGRVINASNQKPISEAAITLGTLSTTSDIKGIFNFSDIDAGSVTIQAKKPVFLGSTKSVKIVAAGNINVILKLKPITTADLDGQVIDKKSGKAIKGVRVSVSENAVITAADGKYALQKITAGKITILAQHPDYKAGRKNIKLNAGKTFHQNIKLEPRREDVVELEAALKEKGTVDLYGIHFDSGKDQFLPSSLSTLQAVSEVIKSSSGKIFEIAGHTDSDGNSNYNQNLSERRAKTVIKWLIQHGVKGKQLRAKGYGENKPVVPNNSEAGKALNRRVQLKIL